MNLYCLRCQCYKVYHRDKSFANYICSIGQLSVPSTKSHLYEEKKGDGKVSVSMKLYNLTSDVIYTCISKMPVESVVGNSEFIDAIKGIVCLNVIDVHSNLMGIYGSNTYGRGGIKFDQFNKNTCAKGRRSITINDISSNLPLKKIIGSLSFKQKIKKSSKIGVAHNEECIYYCNDCEDYNCIDGLQDEGIGKTNEHEIQTLKSYNTTRLQNIYLESKILDEKLKHYETIKSFHKEISENITSILKDENSVHDKLVTLLSLNRKKISIIDNIDITANEDNYELADYESQFIQESQTNQISEIIDSLEGISSLESLEHCKFIHTEEIVKSELVDKYEFKIDTKEISQDMVSENTFLFELRDSIKFDVYATYAYTIQGSFTYRIEIFNNKLIVSYPKKKWELHGSKTNFKYIGTIDISQCESDETIKFQYLMICYRKLTSAIAKEIEEQMKTKLGTKIDEIVAKYKD